MNFTEILHKQREFFATNTTKSIRFRKKQLEKLKAVCIENEQKLYEAIHKDFGRSEFETYSLELSFIINEINYFLKNLNSLAKPKKVSTNILNQIGSSKIYSEPYGNTLVIGAWNYPYQLSIVPVIGALAAGNTVILKPSEISENTAFVMAEIINTNFPEEVLHVILGGIDETTELLKLKFDKIFFTGSPKVGQIVYEAAAKHLIPVTLELGGKSPAIVTSSATIEVAAKRIVWGKFINAGQTCIAPDYIYVDELLKDDLLENLKKYIQKFKYDFGSENYVRIINHRNFDRLMKFINQEKVFFGGTSDAEKLHIEPTIMGEVTWDDAVMQEEIFGPILPVLSYKKLDEALLEIAKREKPLSAYLFSNSNEEMEAFTQKISFGGGCINDVLMHISNDNLPFGGIGNSGMGSYHGKFGFDTFSHRKSVLKRATWGEPNFKYPPYTKGNKNLIKKIMKF